MSQVRLAISPARRPALADSRTITRLRSGIRVQLAKTRRSLTSLKKDFCLSCLAWSKALKNMTYSTYTFSAMKRAL